jgi:cyanophycinase
MTGTLCLQGGGPFTANDELDRRMLNGHRRVVVLPTADAFEHPERLIAASLPWAERLGVEVNGLMVLRRTDATEADMAAVVRAATAVYLVGDQPLHLRSVLKDTPVWEALQQVLVDGGVVVAVGGSADAVCDPMIDPRGGAFTLGLGLVTGLALATEAETWSAERLARTLKLAATEQHGLAVATMPSGSALVRSDAGWEQVGDVVVQGELPAVSERNPGGYSNR